MKGLPYWGEDTFTTLRSLDKINFPLVTLEELSDLYNFPAFLSGHVDVFSLFKWFIEENLLFMVEDDRRYLSWCADIRFNYRDRYMFIPYYKYETLEVPYGFADREYKFLDRLDGETVSIRYNFELVERVLDSRQSGVREKVISLFDRERDRGFSLSIEHLPYLSGETFSMHTLHDSYTQLLAGSSNEPDKDYWRIQNGKFKTKEQQLRSAYELPVYAGEFNDLNYTDVRYYTLEECLERGLLPNDIPYSLRVYLFEAYLYCVAASGVLPVEEEFKSDWVNLGSRKRFMTVSKNNVPLILKHYYKDGSGLRKKSYDRFVIRE